jgi:hypothetical protein
MPAVLLREQRHDKQLQLEGGRLAADYRGQADHSEPHREPSEIEVKKSRDITIEMINNLEALRKTNPEASIKDVEIYQMSEPLPRIKLNYRDGDEYFSIFSKLIERESMIDKKEKERQSQKDVEVTWELSLKKRWLAKFAFPSSEEYGTNWQAKFKNRFIGNEMKISCNLIGGTTYSSRGHAIRFTSGTRLLT